MIMMTDYYKILEINPTVSTNDIKDAYRRLAFKWHPERNGSNIEEATKKFKEISNAYEILSNPKNRKRYDDERIDLFDPFGFGFGFGSANSVDDTSNLETTFINTYTFKDPKEIYKSMFPGKSRKDDVDDVDHTVIITECDHEPKTCTTIPTTTITYPTSEAGTSKSSMDSADSLSEVISTKSKGPLCHTSTVTTVKTIYKTIGEDGRVFKKTKKVTTLVEVRESYKNGKVHSSTTGDNSQSSTNRRMNFKFSLPKFLRFDKFLNSKTNNNNPKQ